jgi:uncharacterized protein YndB with AHSA1/START domain
MKKLIVKIEIPNEIHMERTFDAPKHLVREAMSKPELVKRWAGNSHSPVTSVEIDFRVGGRYRYQFALPDGGSFAFVGEYREISDDHVVYTESMEGQPGEATITTKFVEREGKTTLKIVMAFPTREIRDMVLSTGMEHGAAESYDNLEALLRAQM